MTNQFITTLEEMQTLLTLLEKEKEYLSMYDVTSSPIQCKGMAAMYGLEEYLLKWRLTDFLYGLYLADQETGNEAETALVASLNESTNNRSYDTVIPEEFKEQICSASSKKELLKVLVEIFTDN